MKKQTGGWESPHLFKIGTAILCIVCMLGASSCSREAPQIAADYAFTTDFLQVSPKDTTESADSEEPETAVDTSDADDKAASSEENAAANLAAMMISAAAPVEEDADETSAAESRDDGEIIQFTYISPLAVSPNEEERYLNRNADAEIGISEDYLEQYSAKESAEEVSADAAISGISGRFRVQLDFYDREDILCDTPMTTVGELLTSLGVALSDGDRMHLDADAVIDSDMEILVDKVEYKQATVTEAIPYSTVYTDVQTIPKGTTSVTRKGSEGIKTLVYKQEYVNGQLVDSVLISETVTKEPVSQKMNRGVGGTLVGSDGKTYSFSHYWDMEATTYTGGGITKSGLPATEDVVAVDRSVIPLGTMLYVKSSYGDFGVRVAADIGGAVKGNIIDVYLEEDNPLFKKFGRRPMRVYFLIGVESYLS